MFDNLLGGGLMPSKSLSFRYDRIVFNMIHTDT